MWPRAACCGSLQQSGREILETDDSDNNDLRENQEQSKSTYDTLFGTQVLSPTSFALWNCIFRFPGNSMLMFLSMKRGSRVGIPASGMPLTTPGIASRVALVKHSSVSSWQGWMKSAGK